MFTPREFSLPHEWRCEIKDPFSNTWQNAHIMRELHIHNREDEMSQ